MPSAYDSQDEITQEIKVGPILLTKTRGGGARFQMEGDNTNIWTWPTFTSAGPFHDWAEQLAKALALIDGRFEVRRYK